MQYNIIRNSYFTVSGTTTLSYADLWKLQDEDTTISGVTISGVTSLLVDLSQRIKVDGIHLYASDLSQAANIYFYYKNYAADEYTQLTTYSGASYYYTTIASPSAPQFIKATTSGITITLYEFEVLNDDYTVAYGEDGSLSTAYLSNTLIGSESEAQTIPIYNNASSGPPVNAYTCLEYTGDDADNYVELSSTENGDYYSLEDGVILQDSLSTSTYVWDMGRYNRTSLSSNKIYASNNSLNSSFYEQCYMGDIPLPSNDTYSWYVGNNAWDYDSVNKIIYAIGNESNSSLRLYKYPLSTLTWSYLGDIYPGYVGTDIWRSVMCYLNGYAYVMYTPSGNFGKYNLAGASGNWTTLSGAGLDSTYVIRIGMCSDKQRYIYMVTHNYLDDSHKIFKRYDSFTDTWSTLSSGYVNGYGAILNVAHRSTLSYDSDRNYIYADIGDQSTNAYIQRYIVSSDTWDTTWLSQVSIGNTSSMTSSNMSYYKGFLFCSNGYNSQTWIAYYNTFTGQYGTLSNVFGAFNYTTSDRYLNSYSLAVDSVDGDDAIGIFGANMTINIDGFYYWKYKHINDSYTYTTPVFELEDANKSSYFVVEGNTSSGTGSSISYDASVYNGTIRVRSSNTKPLPRYESYVLYPSGDYTYAYKWIPYTNYVLSQNRFGDNYTSDSDVPLAVDISRNALYMAYSNYDGDYDKTSHGTYIYDMYGNLITSIRSATGYLYMFNDKFEFDYAYGLWGYGNYDQTYSRILKHYDIDLSLLGSYSESQQDFLYDMCTEKNGRGCWYTNSLDNTLVHMNSNCSKLKTIYLTSPTFLASTMDNGCWVVDIVDSVSTFVRYTASGIQSNAVAVPYNTTYNTYEVSTMTGDFNNGLWYRNGDYVYHMTEAGVFDVGPVLIVDSDQLRGGADGCFAYSTDDNLMYFIDMSGTIVSHSTPSSTTSFFGAICHRYEDDILYQQSLLPIHYDPVWGNNGSLAWEEVSKDGHFLSKMKYHQAEITLQGGAQLEKVIMAPTIVTEDIPYGESRDMYVKTNIPSGTAVQSYEANLRTWWGVDE